MRLGTPFTSDEGAYGLQVRALEAGSWAYRYPAERYDPDGRYFPIVNSAHSEKGWFPYVRHPVYPVVLWASARMFGEVAGLHLLPLAGAVVTAAAAWLIASELDRRTCRLAFWVAALGPVLVNGFIIWAHTLAAAATGLCTWVAARALRRGRATVPALAATGSLSAIGGLLRSEALLFGAALGGVLVMVAVRGRSSAALLAGVATLLGVGAAAAADHVWRAVIVGSVLPETSRAGGSSLVDRLEGARATLIGAHFANPKAGVLAALALALLVAAVVILRRSSRPRPAVLLWAIVMATALWVLRLLIDPADPITGILPAWPAIVVGLGRLQPNGLTPPHRVLVAAAGAFVLAVVATQYPEAGGLEWGGRFLLPLAAPVAALAAPASGPSAWVRQRVRSSMRSGTIALLLVVPAVLGLVSVTRQRHRVAGLVDAVSAQRSVVLVSMDSHLPRLGWREDAVWMTVGLSEDAGSLLRHLARERVPTVTLYAGGDLNLAQSGYRRIEDPAARSQGPKGWRVVVVSEPRAR